MPNGVFNHVVEGAPQQIRVGLDRAYVWYLRGHLYLPSFGGHAPARRQLLDQISDVDLSEQGPKAAGIGLGQEQELFEHPSHVLDLDLHAVQHLLIVRGRAGPGERDVDRRANHCEGAAQLVRGIRREAPHSVGAPLEPAQHLVERGPELIQAVASILTDELGKALMGIAATSPAGNRLRAALEGVRVGAVADGDGRVERRRS